MGRGDVNDMLAERIMLRARGKCEYCLLPERAYYVRFHIDHIISIKQGGSSHASNLAYSCSFCNIAKGPSIASYVEMDESIIPLFHPRKDTWENHLELTPDGQMFGRTEVGRGTVRLLKMNDLIQFEYRVKLINKGYDLLLGEIKH